MWFLIFSTLLSSLLTDKSYLSDPRALLEVIWVWLVSDKEINSTSGIWFVR